MKNRKYNYKISDKILVNSLMQKNISVKFILNIKINLYLIIIGVVLKE